MSGGVCAVPGKLEQPGRAGCPFPVPFQDSRVGMVPEPRPGLPQELTTVRVQDPRVQNEGSWNSYVDYKIFLHTNSRAFTAKTSCVRRRYREFVWLRRQLQRNAGLVPVPELPGKSAFFVGSTDEFIERRRQGLQHFLESCASLGSTQGCLESFPYWGDLGMDEARPESPERPGHPVTPLDSPECPTGHGVTALDSPECPTGHGVTPLDSPECPAGHGVTPKESLEFPKFPAGH
ncbi:sorting nexin-11 isoform X3 [Agelaius tricolor]|uniref:sorting nexin-11 isoform X3 n=1 Tax=Agelaius tricolor TaxID=9191 RepID=UPI0039F2095E